MEKTKVAGLEIDLFDIRENLFNIQELEPNKCIINFVGKRNYIGEVDHRAPLVLDCPIQEVIDLINALPVTKFKL